MTDDKLKGVKFSTPTFRLSFPRLKESEAYQGKGQKYYSITMLFNQDDNRDVMKQAILDAIAEKFGTDKKKWPKIKLPWRKGDDKADLAGYAGKIYASAKTREENKPVFVDSDKTKLESADKFYGGCYARAVLVAKLALSGKDWYVTFYLQGVQFVADGEPFGTGVNINEDFEDVSGAEDDAGNFDDGFEEEDDFDI